jgi:hypothetical protein
MLAGLGLLAVIAVGIVMRDTAETSPAGQLPSNSELSRGIVDHSAGLKAIRRELAELRALVEELESDVNRLNRELGNTVAGGEPALLNLSDRLGRKVESSSDGYRANPEGEELFRADAEPTSSAHDEAVASAFQDVGGLYQLDDVYCKQSVCKVSYRPQKGRSPQAASMDSNELMNSLSTHLGVLSLSARHAREEDGSLTMYLQLP